MPPVGAGPTAGFETRGIPKRRTAKAVCFIFVHQTSASPEKCLFNMKALITPTRDFSAHSRLSLLLGKTLVKARIQVVPAAGINTDDGDRLDCGSLLRSQSRSFHVLQGSVLLPHDASRLSEPEINGRPCKDDLQKNQQNANQFQTRERLWPAVPKRKRSASGNNQPEARQQCKKPRLWTANDLSNRPTPGFEIVGVGFHTRHSTVGGTLIFASLRGPPTSAQKHPNLRYWFDKSHDTRTTLWPVAWLLRHLATAITLVRVPIRWPLRDQESGLCRTFVPR